MPVEKICEKRSRTGALLAFIAVLSVMFFVNGRLELTDDANTVFSGFIIGATLLCSAVFAWYRNFRGALCADTVILLIFICGFALRLAYTVRYGYYVHQHDVESLDSCGHLSYIYGIAKGDGLPDANTWQYSHPPLHHILAAAVVKLSWIFGFNDTAAFENIQLLTCFYSGLLMFAGYQLLRACGISGKPLVFCALLLAFHPIFYILAGSINNDTLTILLSVYAATYLVKWYREPSVKYALIIGAFTGFAMMTKFSAALLAAAAAITVLIKFFSCKDFRLKGLILQTLCFLAVMLPLGLWHPVRNYILFAQPLGYVAPLSTDSALYIGDISILKRLLLPFPTDPVGVYTDVWSEYNLWWYLLRNSLFGEYTFGNAGLALITVICNLILIAVSAAAFVFLIKKKQGIAVPVMILAAVQMLFFVYFNIKYPFGCTMDFRYIVPVLFCEIACIGMAGTRLEAEDGGIVQQMIFPAVGFVIAAFCVSSVLVFI